MTRAKIIVIGHGKFASGIKSSLELFIGKQDSANFIDFTKEMNEIELRKKLNRQITDEETILFTDLLGGTPYKEAAEIAYTHKNVGVVTGCNLNSLLETAYKDYQTKEEMMEDLIDITKKTAQIFQVKDLEKNIEKEDDLTDGI